MSFVTEYISSESAAQHDLARICGEAPAPSLVSPVRRDWTIDRERNAFLIKLGRAHEEGFSGYVFNWRGSWMFFEMCPKASRIDSSNRSCWTKFQVKGFPAVGESGVSAEVIEDLKAAIVASPETQMFDGVNHSASIEFI